MPNDPALTHARNIELLGRLHSVCNGKPDGGAVMYWAALLSGVKTHPFAYRGHIVLVYDREAFAPSLTVSHDVQRVLSYGIEPDMGDSSELPVSLAKRVRQAVAAAGKSQRGAEIDADDGKRRNPAGALVRVSWNLSKNCYTVQQHQGGAKWAIAGYSPTVYMTDARVFWRPSDKAKFVRERRRQVFALWEGTWEQAPKKLRFQQAPWRRVTFNPWRDPDHFIDRESGQFVDDAQAVYGTSMETPTGTFADFYYLPNADMPQVKQNPELPPVTRVQQVTERVGDGLHGLMLEAGGDTLYRLDLLPVDIAANTLRAMPGEEWAEILSVTDVGGGKVQLQVAMRAA